MKSKFCTIYLIRHGETEWNLADRLQGQTDSPLTKKGRLQAKNIAQALKLVKFSAIYSSDLGRAQATAKIIALDHHLAFTTNRLLRERYFGRMEGKYWSELNVEHKQLLDSREKLAGPDRFRHHLYPEIESDADIVARLITFMREVAVGHLGQNILVVSHGGIMRALLIHLGFATYEELPGGSIKNSGYIQLTCDGTDFFIVKTSGIQKTPTI